MLNDAQLKTVLQAAGFTIEVAPKAYRDAPGYALTSPPFWTGAHISQDWQQSEAVAWRAGSYYTETTDFWFAMLDAIVPYNHVRFVRNPKGEVLCAMSGVFEPQFANTRANALAAALYAYVSEKEAQS